MNFAAIIPDRGDRPEFLQQCMKQIRRFTLQPTEVYAVSYPPSSDKVDLVQRVRAGISLASKNGIDIVFIIENDDFYPEDYFDRFAPFFPNYEFFGDDHTTYYNLKNKTYRTWHHPFRSSLFTTGFKISALNLFEWPPDDYPFLDIRLWEYAKRRKKKFIDSGAVGIKHGVGKTGGKGHYMRFTDVDVDLKFLKSRVNGSIDFYENMMKKI